MGALFGLVFFSFGCASLKSASDRPSARGLDTLPSVNDFEEDDSPKQRLFVLPFLDEKPGRSDRALTEARKAVVMELTRTRRFVIINNQDFPKDVKSEMGEDGGYNLEAIARMASQMGIAAVLEGRILEVKVKRLGDSLGLFRQTKVRVEATIRVRVIAAKSGKEILNEQRTASAEDVSTRVGDGSYGDRVIDDDPTLIRQAVREAFAGSVQRIASSMEKLSWEGRVAMISGERVFVNAGRLSGLQIGDLLKVTEDGEEVFDPDSGKFIGRAPGRMKGTIEVVSYFGKDGSIAIVHSGSGFRENDRVELY